MTTTPYGYLNPIPGDLSKGSFGWMASWNFNVTRFDAHSHNGVDSPVLASANIGTSSVVASAASWTANTGSNVQGIPAKGYSQLVTVPSTIFEMNLLSLTFLIATSGTRQYQPLALFYSRQTATTFTLYCNDNTVDVLCVFR